MMVCTHIHLQVKLKVHVHIWKKCTDMCIHDSSLTEMSGFSDVLKNIGVYIKLNMG